MLCLALAALLAAGAGGEPKIVHTPLEKSARGATVEVEALITDPAGIFQPLVFARPAGQKYFSSYPMEDRGDDRYVAELPGSILSRGFFDYFVEASTNEGATNHLGSQERPLRVTGFDPPPKRGGISVRSEPPGADVYIDGAPEGKAPQVVQLNPGKHIVALTMPGRRGVEHIFDLLPGRDLDLFIPLAEGSAPASLSIGSEPAGAKVLVDGEQVGTTPFKGPASPGAHRITLELTGHLRPERDVIVKEGRDVEFSFALPELPKDPALSVDSEPSGAAVAIDGKDRGQSPWIGPLAAGPHTVVVRMEGRREAETSFVMPKGRDLSLRLALPAAQVNQAPHITVATVPPGAAVLVDGAEVGISPWTGEVEAGDHRLQIALAGFQKQEKKVAVTKSRDAEVTFALLREPGPAHLRVETEPAFAEVFVDGKAAGTSPWTGELQAGEHQIEARKQGFRGAAQQIAVEQGQSSSLRLALSPASAGLQPPQVQVITQPQGAKVTLDGALLGQTPLKARTTAATHALRMELDGYQPRDAKFTFPEQRDVELVLAVSLKPLREATSLEGPDAADLARAQLKRAQACYAQGDFPCALQGFRAAFEYKAVPELLFNIAQSRRKKGDLKEAAEAYRAFVQKAPRSPLSQEAQRWAQNCDQALAGQSAPKLEEDTTPPVIAHQAVAKALRGQPLRLVATIQDDRSGVFGQQACFRNLYAPDYACAPLVLVGTDQYAVEVPARAVADGLSYFIEAYDNAGNGPARSGAPEVPHTVAMQERPPPPSGPRILEFNSSMTPPQMISGPGLKYTQQALDRNVEGQMSVSCVITTAGVVRNCKVLKGLPFMDAAVVQTLQSRRYSPALLQGKPVDVEFVFNISLGLP